MADTNSNIVGYVVSIDSTQPSGYLILPANTICTPAGNAVWIVGSTPPTQDQINAAFTSPFVTVHSPLEILNMLTLQEYQNILAAITNPQMNLWWAQLLSAAEVRSDDTRTITGCQAAVTNGILTADRVLTIFGVTV